jgi:methylthioribose-1-phosphate isomerase
MIPSIRTIQTRLKLDRPTALKLRKLLDGRLDPMEFESVKQWVAQCFNMPRRTELIECAANELLGTYGVEAIESKEWVDSYHGNIRYTYCNTGDSYGATLVRDCVKGRWLVTSFGDLAENDPDLV